MKEIRGEVQTLLIDLRQVCAELRPPMLDTLGLGATLRALAGDWSDQTGVVVQLDLPADAALRSLPGDVAVNVYRVVQEALSNVARHAHAARCRSIDSCSDLPPRDASTCARPAGSARCTDNV